MKPFHPDFVAALIGVLCSMGFGTWLNMPWYAQTALGVVLTLNFLHIFRSL